MATPFTREDYEHAARAARLRIEWEERHDAHWVALGQGWPIKIWEPGEDNDQAMRLSVALQLTVCNEHLAAGAAYCTRGEDEVFPEVRSGTSADADVTAEDYVATRHAIVRAAIEIGKAMLAPNLRPEPDEAPAATVETGPSHQLGQLVPPAVAQSLGQPGADWPPAMVWIHQSKLIAGKPVPYLLPVAVRADLGGGVLDVETWPGRWLAVHPGEYTL